MYYPDINCVVSQSIDGVRPLVPEPLVGNPIVGKCRVNVRDPYEADRRAPSGANGISNLGSPSEAEGSDWLSCSLVVE